MKQLKLPGIVSAKIFKTQLKKLNSWNRIRTMDFEEGMRYLAKQYSESRKINGHLVENVCKPSATRFKMFRKGNTTCVKCGLQGVIWHIERHKNDSVMPFFVNLYGIRKGLEVMMTWDHKIPRSLGGSNRLENAQCMCETCNHKKGNSLTIFEMVELVTDKKVHRMYSDHIDKVPLHALISKAISGFESLAPQRN